MVAQILFCTRTMVSIGPVWVVPFLDHKLLLGTVLCGYWYVMVPQALPTTLIFIIHTMVLIGFHQHHLPQISKVMISNGEIICLLPLEAVP